MRIINERLNTFLTGLVILGLLAVVNAPAQTQVKPGFNIFSQEQDVEIGRQSAAEVEGQLPILKDRDVERYVSDIGKRLAAVAPGAKYPYQFKVVNVSDINAFALPGGFMYVNRGLVEVAQSEGELAGVMAHEMAHVALRHGTNQASKAYLAQAGLGVLGGIFGGSGATGQIIGTLGGFGLNTLFLKFSRTAEQQADVGGAQIMSRAGYNPMDMVSMFETLRRQSDHDPGKVEEFFSDHPSPAHREERIRQEADLLGPAQRVKPLGDFAQVRSDLHRRPPAPSMQQIARRQPPSADGRSEGGQTAKIRIDPPSSHFRKFEQRSGFFQIDYPENWQTYEAGKGYGVTIVPPSGVVDTGNGQPSIICGVIINHYDSFDGSVEEGSHGSRKGRATLEETSHDLINQVMKINPHLRLIPDSERRERVDEGSSLSAVLSGRSPVTGQEERVTLCTRELSDGHVIYALFIAPGRDYDELGWTFQHMISSLRVNDDAAHR